MNKKSSFMIQISSKHELITNVLQTRNQDNNLPTDWSTCWT